MTENPADLKETTEPPSLLGALKGAFFAGAFVLLGVIAALGLVLVGFLLWFFGFLPGVYIVGVLTLAAPFLLCMYFGKGSWLLGAAWGAVMIFVVAPSVFYFKVRGYIWAGSLVKKEQIILAILYFLLSMILAGLGEWVAAKRGSQKLLARPYQSIALLLVLCILLSLATPFARDAVATGSSNRYIDKRYEFEFSLPGGWRRPDAVTIPVNELSSTKGVKWIGLSDDKFNVRSPDSGFIDGEVRIFDRIPYTNTPVSSFRDAKDCYTALLKAYEENVPRSSVDYTMTPEQSRQKVDGVLTLKLRTNDSSNHERYTDDVWIFDTKYLYRVRFRFLFAIGKGFGIANEQEANKIASDVEKQILDSFKLLKPGSNS